MSVVNYSCKQCGEDVILNNECANHIETNQCINTNENKIYEHSTEDYSIINSCCIEGLTNMKNENKKIHLTITSPPYYNVKDYVNYSCYKEYLDTLKNVFTLIYEITEDGRMCCVNISNILIQRESRNSESSRIPLAFHFVPLMEEIGWKFIEDIIWLKPEGASKKQKWRIFPT